MNLIENTECALTGSMQIKNEEKQEKDITKISGIYKIINKINGKYYVGSSSNIKTRWSNHKNELIGNRHGNKYLQRAWNKYGIHNFEFVIIQIANVNELVDIEQKYLNEINNNRKVSYNLSKSPQAFMLGRHHTKETKRKIGLSNIGKHSVSLEHRKILSDIMKKRCGKLNSMYGKKRSPELKQKMMEPLLDKNIYYFFNIESNETFCGTRIEFRKKYNMDVYNMFNLIHHRTFNVKKWTRIYPIYI